MDNLTEIEPVERRAFIKGAGSVAAGVGLTHGVVGATLEPCSKIARIELFPMRYPMNGYFKFFTGAHGSEGRAAVIVKITAEDGSFGWGQSVPIAKWSYETLETAVVVMRDYWIPVLTGRDPSDIAGAHAAMDEVVAPGFSTAMPISRAGIDIALHDLVGKQRSRSLAGLWGRKPVAELDLSWTVNVRKLEDVARVMESGRALGYRHFNIKVAPDPEFDVALARAVREKAPDAFLWADANGGYEPAVAMAVAPRLANAGVDVLEAPLRPNQIRGYQALSKLGALPIYMDEGVVSVVELEEFVHLGMLDGMAMKPARCGGLWSNRRQIEFCLERELGWLGSGLTDPDISLAATLGLYGAYGLRRPAALNGPQFLDASVLATPLKIKDGRAQVPTLPGLGIEVDEEKVVALMKRSGGDKLLMQ